MLPVVRALGGLTTFLHSRVNSGDVSRMTLRRGLQFCCRFGGGAEKSCVALQFEAHLHHRYFRICSEVLWCTQASRLVAHSDSCCSDGVWGGWRIIEGLNPRTSSIVFHVVLRNLDQAVATVGS